METFQGHHARHPGNLAPKTQKEARACMHARNYNIECDFLI